MRLQKVVGIAQFKGITTVSKAEIDKVGRPTALRILNAKQIEALKFKLAASKKALQVGFNRI